MKIIACFNIKGGVGKTAAAVNLSSLAARQGLRTLLWDLDPQAAASWYFRTRPRIRRYAKRMMKRKAKLSEAIRGTDDYGLDIVASDFSYRKLAVRLAGLNRSRQLIGRQLRSVEDDYDVALLDCAPNLSLVSESVFDCADALLVPTIPTPLSQRTLEQLRRHLRKKGGGRPMLLPMLSMVDRRKKLHNELCEWAEEDEEFLTAKIPYSSPIEQMGIHRAPLFAYADTSVGALAYRAVWREVCERVGLPLAE